MAKSKEEKLASDILKEMKLQTQILKAIHRTMYQKDIDKALTTTCCCGIERSGVDD